jgi:hypothetical protein
MNITEKIDLALYEFYKKNPTQPSGILMHLLDAHNLYDYFCEELKIDPLKGIQLDQKYRGIDIYRSYDLKEGEIKLIY